VAQRVTRGVVVARATREPLETQVIRETTALVALVEARALREIPERLETAGTRATMALEETAGRLVALAAPATPVSLVTQVRAVEAAADVALGDTLYRRFPLAGPLVERYLEPRGPRGRGCRVVEQADRALLEATQALLQLVQLEIRVMLDQLAQTETPEQPETRAAQETRVAQERTAIPEQLVLQGPAQPLEMLEVRARLGLRETPGPPGLRGLELRPEPQATPEARPRQPTQIRPL
jgi:hypothetical protein